ncbi:head-tail connector protein [Acinetobacter junii]|uniref:head-tail connector protein n=1 Tax=Acinetobacter junii TaxID=40215 RepID=UPI00285F28A6|nr:head-tail connector protein [Acinetobacter junii]MDR7654539.1 head-tail connector protein [Acinetobacter junii]
MSTYIEPAIVKTQLRVLHTRDDTYIDLLTKAALKYIENFIDKPLDDVLIDGIFPEDLTIAALLVITDMYENRAAQTEVNLYVNRAVENYMLPYRKMGV